MIHATSSKPVGRYDGSASQTRLPPAGRAKPSPHLRTTLAAVADPYGNGKERLLVTVNRNVDVLETERSAGRIDEAAYQTGRIIQAVFERVNKVGSSNWAGGSRVDAASAHETAIAYAVENAALVNKTVARIEKAVGIVGCRFLRSILAEGLTFAQAAALRGQSGRHAGTYAGERFRAMLEDLAKEWEAEGKSAAQIVASFSDRPDEVASEPRVRPENPPIIAGRSQVTADLGRRALVMRIGSERPSKEQKISAVRGGVRRRG